MNVCEDTMINVANVVGLNSHDWQNSAEEARVVAESMQDEQSKQLMLRVAKEYERVAKLTQERPKRWRGKTYGMCAAFCTAFAAATARCGVGTSIDVFEKLST
jgi:RNA polymerase-binding transcription factor DksA